MAYAIPWHGAPFDLFDLASEPYCEGRRARGPIQRAAIHAPPLDTCAKQPVRAAFMKLVAKISQPAIGAEPPNSCADAIDAITRYPAPPAAA